MKARLDTAPCGFVSVGDDGTMLEVNQTLATMLGYSRLDLEGWHLQKILAPGGRIFYQTHVFPLLRMHGVVEELYVPLRNRQNADIPMLMNASRRESTPPVNDCVFVRMLQRHAFEDQLIAARRSAEEASSAKAKFLSMMSHDLRTPLTAISGYSALIGEGSLGEVTADQKEALSTIRRACTELLVMIDDILAFARLDSGRVSVRMRTLPAAEAMERAASLVGLRASEAELQLRVESCEEPTLICCDPDRLQQILLNLLTNAIKFTPAGGSLSLRCEHSEKLVRLSVSDTGIGIPSEDLNRVFDPFVQLSQSAPTHAQGVGLGLAISRELAHAMNAELSVVSTPGAGSTFTIALPAAGAAAEQGENAS